MIFADPFNKGEMLRQSEDYPSGQCWAPEALPQPSPYLLDKEAKNMIDRIDEHPTPLEQRIFEKRKGKDRRKMHTMLDPDKDRRKGERRKKRLNN